jgi:NAD(P)-dependent dehydrogenase (short-subunit alcohol dehydrogenase family)
VAADWTKMQDCERFAAACVDAWGRIDSLQNNAGIGADDADPLTCVVHGSICAVE